jgi:hypothetical protein
MILAPRVMRRHTVRVIARAWAASASRARAHASCAPMCARRASSLTTYAVTTAIARAAAASPSAMAKLWTGGSKKKSKVRYETSAATPACRNPYPIATGRTANRYKPVSAAGSMTFFRAGHDQRHGGDRERAGHEAGRGTLACEPRGTAVSAEAVGQTTQAPSSRMPSKPEPGRPATSGGPA